MRLDSEVSWSCGFSNCGFFCCSDGCAVLKLSFTLTHVIQMEIVTGIQTAYTPDVWIGLFYIFPILTSSSLDLTCSTVQQIQIESSDCSCDSLRRVLKGDHLPELIIGRSVCVSSNSCTFQTYSISTSSVLRNLTIAFNEMLTPSTSICWYLFIYYFLLLLFAGTHNRLQRVIDLDGDYEQTCRWGSWITGRLLSHTMDIFCTFIQ